MHFVIFLSFLISCEAAHLNRGYLPSQNKPFETSYDKPISQYQESSIQHDIQDDVKDSSVESSKFITNEKTYAEDGGTVAEMPLNQYQNKQDDRNIDGAFEQRVEAQPEHTKIHSLRGSSTEGSDLYYKNQNESTSRLESDLTSESFAYHFETENGIRAEENGVATDGVKAKGSFSYVDDGGKMYSIAYTADEDGYKPFGAHLPTPPPIPEAILRSIEQNARDEAAGIFDDGKYHPEENASDSYSKNSETNNFNTNSMNPVHLKSHNIDILEIKAIDLQRETSKASVNNSTDLDNDDLTVGPYFKKNQETDNYSRNYSKIDKSQDSEIKSKSQMDSFTSELEDSEDLQKFNVSNVLPEPLYYGQKQENFVIPYADKNIIEQEGPLNIKEVEHENIAVTEPIYQTPDLNIGDDIENKEVEIKQESRSLDAPEEQSTDAFSIQQNLNKQEDFESSEDSKLNVPDIVMHIDSPGFSGVAEPIDYLDDTIDYNSEENTEQNRDKSEQFPLNIQVGPSFQINTTLEVAGELKQYNLSEIDNLEAKRKKYCQMRCKAQRAQIMKNIKDKNSDDIKQQNPVDHSQDTISTTETDDTRLKNIADKENIPNEQQNVPKSPQTNEQQYIDIAVPNIDYSLQSDDLEQINPQTRVNDYDDYDNLELSNINPTENDLKYNDNATQNIATLAENDFEDLKDSPDDIIIEQTVGNVSHLIIPSELQIFSNEPQSFASELQNYENKSKNVDYSLGNIGNSEPLYEHSRSFNEPPATKLGVEEYESLLSSLFDKESSLDETNNDKLKHKQSDEEIALNRRPPYYDPETGYHY